MARRAITALCCSLWLLGACSTSESGVQQPFRVRNAQFLPGELPGVAPDPNSHSNEEGEPLITALETANLNVFQGQGGKAFTGRSSTNASSIAVALDGVGSGYWVVPTQSVDTATGDLTFSFSTDFDISITPGSYGLRVVAVDEAGEGGDQLLLDLCVGGRVPDNGSICSGSAVPPQAVLSLQWDANSDLDLSVVTPSGDVLDAKRSSVAAAAGGLSFDRDSNASCVIDGLRTENLVWNDPPEAGDYFVYVNMFDACRQPSVRFSVNLYTWEESDDGFARVRRVHRTGELLDIAADPAAERGLFITKLTFN